MAQNADPTALPNPIEADKPAIGISIGDFNGIGPEIILKTLADPGLLRFMTPVIYGSHKILKKWRRVLNMEDYMFHILNEPAKPNGFNPKKVNVLMCWEEDWDIQPGTHTTQSGQAAFLSLEKAARDVASGVIDGLVTAPIHKANMPAHFGHMGHTGYLSQIAGGKKDLMFMVSDLLRVGVVTEHIPISQVAGAINAQMIESKINLMAESLQMDFGITKPKIAILGLNPHAGEEGKIGMEDETILKPLIQNYQNKNRIVLGPFPADGFFAQHRYRNVDGVLAMYHDQGLIPFKILAGSDGVNFTAGLPFVRTSPAHGTAFDIAGKNLADETSFRAALLAACDIIKQRKTLAK